MKIKLPALAVALVTVAVGTAQAFSLIGKGGTWPKNWPEQLERFRDQAYTINGGLSWYPTLYEIPFNNREEFEAAWPHLLKVKTEGAPVILISSSAKHTFISGHSKPDAPKAGVRISYPHSREFRPPGGQFTYPLAAAKAADAMPPDPFHSDGPIDSKDVRTRWARATHIELVVDGNIVDLNRIALPADTPIVDERFKPAEGAAKADHAP